MRVDRALDKLHAAFARRDIKSTTAVLGAVFAQQALAATPVGLAASVTSGALAAGATVAAAPVATFFQIMTTTKMVAGLAGVALTIAVIGTAYETRLRRATEASLASSVTEQTELKDRLHELETRAVAAEQKAASLKQKTEEASRAQAAAKAKAASSATSGKTKAPWDPVAEGKALLARHPEVKRAAVDGTDAVTHFTLGGMYEKLALTPAQISRLEELMRERSSTGFFVNGEYTLLSPGTGMAWQDLNNELVALLGEERKRKLLDYARDKSDRQLTASVASALCFTDSPLTPVQAGQLVEIITASRSRSVDGTPGELDWEKVAGSARGFLSTTQLAALEGMRAQVAEQELPYLTGK